MSAICLPIDADSGTGLPQFPAAQHRVALAALMGGRTDRSLGTMSGLNVAAGPSHSVSATTWSIGAFSAIVDPETGTAVGPYLVAFTNTQTGSINAANGTHDRIDRLDLQVPDDPPGSDPRAPWIQYTAGTPAASPTPPAAPARSVPISQITVPKSGTGSPSWTSTYPFSVASGGIMPCRDSSAYPPNPWNGQFIYDRAIDSFFAWDGSEWDLIWSDSGWTSVSATNAAGMTGVSVTGRKIGSVVSIQGVVTLTADITVGPTGNIANQTVCTITDADFVPGSGGSGQALSSGTSGPLASFSIQGDGTVTLNATVVHDILSGTTISFSGTYFTD